MSPRLWNDMSDAPEGPPAVPRGPVRASRWFGVGRLGPWARTGAPIEHEGGESTASEARALLGAVRGRLAHRRARFRRDPGGVPHRSPCRVDNPLDRGCYRASADF